MVNKKNSQPSKKSKKSRSQSSDSDNHAAENGGGKDTASKLKNTKKQPAPRNTSVTPRANLRSVSTSSASSGWLFWVVVTVLAASVALGGVWFRAEIQTAADFTYKEYISPQLISIQKMLDKGSDSELSREERDIPGSKESPNIPEHSSVDDNNNEDYDSKDEEEQNRLKREKEEGDKIAREEEEKRITAMREKEEREKRQQAEEEERKKKQQEEKERQRKLKEEEERQKKQREEEERQRKQKEEEERLRKQKAEEERQRKQKEEEDRQRKQKEQEERQRRQKEEEERQRKQKEEEDRQKKRKEEEERQRKQKEEEERQRKRKEEEERQRKQREEEEKQRKQKEEEERQRKRKEEEERQKKQEEERQRKQKEEEEKQRKKKEEEERQKKLKDEEARQIKQEEERQRKQKEEEERQRKQKEEEERQRKQKEEEERQKKLKDEEARQRKQEEERQRKQKEEEERQKKQKEEEERQRKQKEEEERQKKLKDEEARQRKQEEERQRKQKEEEERQRKQKEEEERQRKQKEEEERQRKQKDAEERQKKLREEEERQRKQKEEEERQKKLKEEEERQRKQREEEEEKLRKQKEEEKRQRDEDEKKRRQREEEEKLMAQKEKERQQKIEDEKKRLDEERIQALKEKEEQENKKKEKELDKKRAEAKAEKPTDARADYENSAITNDEDMKIRHKLDEADLLLEEGDFEGAVEKYDAILSVSLESPRAYYGKGLTLDKLGFKHKSNEYLEQAINFLARTLDLPNVPDELYKMAARKLAERQQFRGWGGESVKTYRRLTRKFPDDLELKKELGTNLMMIGQEERAKEVFKQVLSTDPQSGFAKAHMGFILKDESGQMEEAVKLIREGIESGEEGTQTGLFFLHLGDLLIRLGKVDEARAVYKAGEDKGLFISAWQRSLYNVDGLTSRPWWTVEQTGYTNFFKALQDNWKEIRAEGLAQLNSTAGAFLPEDENLRDTGDWKQFTLFQQGRKNKANCEKAPKTCALIQQYPSVETCRRGQVKFSVMSPGIHVWPHTGPTNCRIRAHLGLVVPEGPHIRVMHETRTWKEGELLIFDDSFEHEVWHNGTKLRLVLIVDVWHPELSKAQRRSLSPI